MSSRPQYSVPSNIPTSKSPPCAPLILALQHERSEFREKHPTSLIESANSLTTTVNAAAESVAGLAGSKPMVAFTPPPPPMKIPPLRTGCVVYSLKQRTADAASELDVKIELEQGFRADDPYDNRFLSRR